MGLFSSLFGSNDGSKAAAKVAAANSARIYQLGQQDIAERKALTDAMRPDLEYATGVDRGVVDDLDQYAGIDRSRGDELYNDWRDNFKAVGDQYAADAMTAGGSADQERAAGMSVADVAQAASIARASAMRSGAGLGNPNAGNGASDRKFQLAEMAARAGGATKAREDQRRWGIALRGDATKTGMGLLAPAATFSNAGTAATMAKSDIADNAVTRGLNVGNFRVGGYGSAISGLNGATNIQTNALTNTDKKGMLPALIGTGAALYGSGVFRGK